MKKILFILFLFPIILKGQIIQRANPLFTPAIVAVCDSQNLLTYSEQFNQGASWFGNDGFTVTVDTDEAPDGTTTAETLEPLASWNAIYQTVTVTAETEYTFSFYAKAGTATACRYLVYDLTNSAGIVAATDYYSQLNGSTFTRISTTFNTPADCVSIGVYVWQVYEETGTLKVWGAQLNEGASRCYTQTEDTVVE